LFHASKLAHTYMTKHKLKRVPLRSLEVAFW
jgi:hypothetical protein